MVTVTLDEITLNAVKAALDERVTLLQWRIAQAERGMDLYSPLSAAHEDAQRALVWNIAALHETKLAREYLGDPEVLVDHPADATYANAR